MIASLTFLTPAAALVGLAVLAPLAAAVLARARVDAVRTALRLPPPGRATTGVVLAGLAAAVLLLALAAAQPALSSTASRRVRTDAQVLFLVDISRSMAAAARPDAPRRVDRAIAATLRLRAAIPEVPAGVATLTDRVLPELLPVPDEQAFEVTVRRAVEIEEPPPRVSRIRATDFSTLGEIPAGNYFAPAARRRVVVLLTDGESVPVDSSELGRAFAKERLALVELRIWRPNESIFVRGRPEAAYQPDPTGLAILEDIARATHGRAFDETRVGQAAAYLRAVVGHGPTSRQRVDEPKRTPLAPYVAALALLPLGLVLRRAGR